MYKRFTDLLVVTALVAVWTSRLLAQDEARSYSTQISDAVIEPLQLWSEEEGSVTGGASASQLLSTDQMTGPLATNAVPLFRKLKVSDDLLLDSEYVTTAARSTEAGEWLPATYAWISPAFSHKPLYFEQPNLERYGLGHVRALQPLVSSAHFFGSIPLIPYKTFTHHPRERVYTLGHSRPGNCVPLQRRVLLGQSALGEGFLFYHDPQNY